MALGLEPVAFIVRAGPDYHRHGDPYTSSGTLLVMGERAFLAGVTADAVWPYRAQFFEELRKLGVKRLAGLRRVDGGASREVEVRVE